MFIVLYRWKIKDGFENQFIEAWAEVTEFIVKTQDSLGSRLHRDTDGVFYGYAQWKSAAQRAEAFAKMPDFPAREKMREAIAEGFPEIILKPVSDFLIFPQKT